MPKYVIGRELPGIGNRAYTNSLSHPHAAIFPLTEPLTQRTVNLKVI